MEVHDNEPFPDTNGVTHDFICEDCGDNVCKYGHHDGVSVCANCRYIRANPDMPEEIKRHLRGED